MEWLCLLETLVWTVRIGLSGCLGEAGSCKKTMCKGSKSAIMSTFTIADKRTTECQVEVTIPSLSPQAFRTHRRWTLCARVVTQHRACQLDHVLAQTCTCLYGRKDSSLEWRLTWHGSEERTDSHQDVRPRACSLVSRSRDRVSPRRGC